MHVLRLFRTVALATFSIVAVGCTLFQSPHERGQRHLRRGDYTRAVEAYSQAIEKGEFVAVAYANRCYAHEARGDYEGALHDCTEALKLMGEPNKADPVAVVEWTEVLNNRGVTNIGLRRYDDAVDDLTMAIDARPDYAEAYANRGRAYVEQEAWDDALEDLEKAVELDRGLAEAWGNKAQALTGKGDADGALEAFGTAIEVSGGNPDIYFNRASLLYATGKFKEALADYRVAAGSTNEQLAWMAQQQATFLAGVEAPTGDKTPSAGATAPSDSTDATSGVATSENPLSDGEETERASAPTATPTPRG